MSKPVGRGQKVTMVLVMAGVALLVAVAWVAVGIFSVKKAVAPMAGPTGQPGNEVVASLVGPPPLRMPEPPALDALAAAQEITLRLIELQAATADRATDGPEIQAAWKVYVAYVHDFPAAYTPTQRVELIDCFADWLYAGTAPKFDLPPPVEPFQQVGNRRNQLYEHYITAILALGESTPPPVPPQAQVPPVSAQPSQPPIPPPSAAGTGASPARVQVLWPESFRTINLLGSTEDWLSGWKGEPPHGGVEGTLLACLPPTRCRTLFVQGVALNLTDARRRWEVGTLCRELRWLGDAKTAEALLADRPPLPPNGAPPTAGVRRAYWDAAVRPTVQFLQAKAALNADDRAVVEAFVRSLCGILTRRWLYWMHAGPWRYQHNMLRARWPKLPLAVYRVVFEHPSATVEDGGWVLRLSEDLTAEDIQQLLGESDRLHRLCADLVSGFQVVPALLYRAKDPWFRTWLLAKEPRSEAKWAGQDGETVQWLACYAADAATAGTPDAAVLARLRQWSDQTLPATALPALKSLWAVKDPGVEDRVRAHLQADPREETKLLAAMIDLAVEMNLRDQMPSLRTWLAQRHQRDHSDHEIRCAVLRAVAAWRDEESRMAVGIIVMDDHSWEQGYARLALQALDAPPKLALPEPTPPVEPPEPPAK